MKRMALTPMEVEIIERRRRETAFWNEAVMTTLARVLDWANENDIVIPIEKLKGALLRE